MNIKDLIRQILAFLHVDLTQNMRYDRQTRQIFKQVLNPESNCIDVGCHKGEMLDEMIRFAPKGMHMAFEPIPAMYAVLKEKYDRHAQIFPYALSDANGSSSFQFVTNAPAYSGIQRRSYKVDNPQIEQIEVELRCLDEIVPSDYDFQLIKIDVEGGEFSVLKGAKNSILRCKPILVFESGLGASEYYGTRPNDLFQFINSDLNYEIFSLQAFLSQGTSYSEHSFVDCYNNQDEYYFVARSK